MTRLAAALSFLLLLTCAGNSQQNNTVTMRQPFATR